MISIENKESNIVKEVRRAKRKRNWLIEGNVIPLSTAEKKAISNKVYRDKIILDNKKKENINFHLEYKNDLYNFFDSLCFTHKGTFTYRNEISMYKCYRDSLYTLGTLLKRGVIDDYLMVTEYEHNHVHSHFLINCNSKTKNIDSSIYQIFNGKYDKGKVWVEPIADERDRKRQSEYFSDKINASSKNNNDQLECDYWYYDTNK